MSLFLFLFLSLSLSLKLYPSLQISGYNTADFGRRSSFCRIRKARCFYPPSDYNNYYYYDYCRCYYYYYNYYYDDDYGVHWLWNRQR